MKQKTTNEATKDKQVTPIFQAPLTSGVEVGESVGTLVDPPVEPPHSAGKATMVKSVTTMR